MKFTLCVVFIFSAMLSFGQTPARQRNLFIITTDGFRWQEVFNGADSLIMRDTAYVKDTTLIRQLYWCSNKEERRKKLMPFFWNVIADKGRLSGNREYWNDVNIANLYKISYPGYNEILTGYADKRFIPNLPVANKNINILEYLNTRQGYAGKVAAFSSWDVMPYIINEKESHVPVNSGYELLDSDGDTLNAIINTVQQQMEHKGSTRYDMLTYSTARNYIEQQHPKVVFLGLGETDEFAHKGMYDQYLQKAHNVDQMIAELWYYVQTDPFYKDNTTFIITTDHGRGSKTNTWDKHGFWIKGSGQAWTAMIGPGILPEGEVKDKQTTYQKQIAATVATLLGERFITDHPVAAPLPLLLSPLRIQTTAAIATIAVNK